MSKTTRDAYIQRAESLSSRISEIFNFPFVKEIILGSSLLLIEYKSGIFQILQDKSIHSISPAWSGIAALTTVSFGISFVNFLRISLSSRKYFREEFSRAALATITSLCIALSLSVSGHLMFWYPLVSILYIVSGQKLAAHEPSLEGYILLVFLIVICYLLAILRHQNWDGIKSTQQHQNDQRNEPSSMLLEGVREIKRILNRESELEKYLEPDLTRLLNPLEPSEDFISQAWKDQACELIRLSSSSYAIDQKSGWHDKQGCWVGQNINTENLCFLYPAHFSLSQKELDNFINYSQGIAKSRNREIDELIVVFREEKDKMDSPTNLYIDIRFETEQNLLENLVNFTDYRNDIRKRVLLDKLLDSELSLNDVYVPSQLLVSQEEKVDSNIEDYLDKWIDEPSQRQLALLGEYGQGKSSAALMFTYRLLGNGKQLPKKIPILIELRGKSPRDLTPLELLGSWTSKYRIDTQALMRLHIAGRLVIIFEGFDEMSLIGNSELRLRHFRSLWRFCYPNVKIIITGRPNFFLDDREMKTALGIIKPISKKPYCEAIRLAPFNIDQIKSALRDQKPLVRDQICYLAANDNRFLDIVSRPSLLNVVSILWEREKLHEKTALLNSAYVMECFVRSCYNRQGRKAQDSREFMALNSSERDYFMCGTASYMAANQLGNQISNERLNELINDLTEVIPNSVSTSASEILDEDTRPLKARMKDPKEDIEHFRTDVRTCGLLVADLSAPGTFKFGHKSFMEYLFATTVKEYIWAFNSEKAKSEKARAIKRITSFPIETILDLPVAISFLAEMIGTDDFARQVRISNNDVNLRGEHIIAIRLLMEIFESKNIQLYRRFLLFCFSYMGASEKLRPAYRNFARLTNPLMIIFFSPYIFFVYHFLPKINIKDSTAPIISISTILLITIIFSIYTNVILLQSVKSKGRESIFRKLRLWNSICKELNLDDKVLHQIAGTWFLPWAKKQPFDYFLSKAQRGEDFVQ
jgi:hypothetical protein